MTTKRRWQGLCAAGLGLALTAVTGCQTHIISAGMTLPTGHYLEHRPQYFPPDPDYPLQRELNTQLNQAAAAAAANPPGVAGPLPPPAAIPPGAMPPPAAVPPGPGARPEAPGMAVPPVGR